METEILVVTVLLITFKCQLLNMALHFRNVYKKSQWLDFDRSMDN